MSALPIDEPVVPLPQRGARVIPFPAGPGATRAAATEGRRSGPRQVRRGAATRPRLRITRRGRLLLTTLALAAGLGALGLVVGGAALAGGDTAEPTRGVVVLPGQTLLDVAATVPGDADLRDVAVDIRDLNRMSGSGVQAGQRLLVPLTAD